MLSRSTTSLSLILMLLAALLVPAGSACAAFAPPSLAERSSGPHRGSVLLVQEDDRPSIFRFLFGPRHEDVEPAPQYRPQPQPQARPRARARAKPRKQRDQLQEPQQQQQQVARPRQQQPAPRKAPRKAVARAAPAAPVAPREPPPVEKAADAKNVLVLGDFAAGALVKGLLQVYAQDPALQVVDGTKGDSGLVRTDVHDWATELSGIVNANKPDAILVMLGMNDRQPIDTPSQSLAFGSDAWTVAYGSRIAALLDALKATGKPVRWVGLAPVRSSVMSRDYSTINSVLRDQLESKGVEFVDSWNGFADENGKFIDVGPDVAGQPVQLRTSDGVNFTRAGQRKLAYFVEQDLKNILNGAGPQVATTETSGGSGQGLEPAEQAPRIGPMLPLDAVETSGQGILSRSSATPAASTTAADAIAKRLAGDPAANAPAGRADDFSWRQGALAKAAAPPQPATDEHSAAPALPVPSPVPVAPPTAPAVPAQ